MAISLDGKAAHLHEQLDFTRSELPMITTSAELVEALAVHATAARYRFEFTRKEQILSFLHEHYAAWRTFDSREADRLAVLTIEQAQESRALWTIAELGKAWWATGDSRYAEGFERFYLAVPTGMMFNFAEFNGTQSTSELDAFFMLQDCPQFSLDGRIAFIDHLYAISENAWDMHTSRWRQSMLGPEGHNWYLHGIHILPFTGLLFPAFKRADFFLRTAWSIVEEHVRGHLKADGGARETCPGYQAGSMLDLWDLYLIAHRNGFPMAPWMTDRLLDGTKFLLRLMTPQGSIPSYGDSGPRAGGLTQLAAVAAALTGDGECKWYAEYVRQFLAGAEGETPGAIPLCAFWNVGLEGAETYAHTPLRNPHHLSVLMGSTGYAALRDTDRPDAAYLAIAAADRGPIVTSHGHNDIFSIEVHAGGTRFIGDMGCTPCYGDTPGRNYDITTEAHSSLAIAGMEQIPIVNEWRWSANVIPAVRRWISEETHDYFHGVHEGYYRRCATLHARKLFFVKSAPSYWVMLDWLEAATENDYQAYFHGCVPGTIDGANILLGTRNGVRLAVLPPEGDHLLLCQVHNDGLAAYHQEKSLDPAHFPCFAYSKRAASDCLAWALMPTESSETLPRIRRIPVCINGAEEDAHGATALEIAFPQHKDILCNSHKDYDGVMEFGTQQTWGWLAFRRITPDGAVTLSIEHTMADGVCGR